MPDVDRFMKLATVSSRLAAISAREVERVLGTGIFCKRFDKRRRLASIG